MRCLLICALVGLATVLIHHGGLLRIADRRCPVRARKADSMVIPSVVVGIFALHLIEIGLYAGAIAFASYVLHLGRLIGDVDGTDLELLYFSAETFTSLGFGDIIPSGPMRLLCSFEPLNGLILLGWSASFIEVDRFWRRPCGSRICSPGAEKRPRTDRAGRDAPGAGTVRPPANVSRHRRTARAIAAEAATPAPPAAGASPRGPSRGEAHGRTALANAGFATPAREWRGQLDHWDQSAWQELSGSNDVLTARRSIRRGAKGRYRRGCGPGGSGRCWGQDDAELAGRRRRHGTQEPPLVRAGHSSRSRTVTMRPSARTEARDVERASLGVQAGPAGSCRSCPGKRSCRSAGRRPRGCPG